METLLNLLSLIGSLGLFLFGMKTMSEGLEKFAGDRLRSVLAAMTKNRVMGVLTGILVTALIQSSSATTVMVVSFVNAGLMTLAQSIGVIMGANVGTTVTAWIISLIGFKVNIAAMSLPLVAIGIPLYFSGNEKRKSIGEFVFGFAFLFMGLSYLQSSANDLNIGGMVAQMLAGLADGGFLTVILFVMVGALVTMLVQASAATMAITLMLFDMHIPGFSLELAAALAMGQNIGTTITAVMASLTAGTQARRPGTYVLQCFRRCSGADNVLPFLRRCEMGSGNSSRRKQPARAALCIPLGIQHFQHIAAHRIREADRAIRMLGSAREGGRPEGGRPQVYLWRSAVDSRVVDMAGT